MARTVHPPDASLSYHASRAMLSLKTDAQFILWHTIVNSIAGSHFVPRLLRYLIYRAMGLDIKSPKFFYGTVFSNRNIHFADNAGASWNCLFEGGPIFVGENTMIGMHCIFTTGNHPLDDEGYPNLLNTPSPIHIGSDCWFGARCMVLGGVTITDRVVVAAGSVVVRDLLEPGIYGGSPAKLIRRHEDVS